MTGGTTASAIQIRRPNPCQPIPDDWQPTQEDIDWAITNRPDIDDLPRFTAKFVAKINAAGGMVGPVWAKWRQWLTMETSPKRRPAKPNDTATTLQPTAACSPQPPAKAVAAHNEAILQEALNILNDRLTTSTAIEIVAEPCHDQ